jgi:hypothetical protein
VRIEDSLYAIADGKITIVNVLDPTDRRATVELRATPAGDPPDSQLLAGVNTATPFDDDGLGKAIAAAQRSLANKLNISEQAAVMVTAERQGAPDSFQIVLRAGDKQYLFHASAAGEATEVQANFSFAARAAREWHNAALPPDTNGDGDIHPIDALVVINQLNLYGSRLLSRSPVRAIAPQSIDPAGLLSFQVDTNGDGYLAPLDALLVINYLNEMATNQRGVSDAGEGESNVAMAARMAQPALDAIVSAEAGLPSAAALSPSTYVVTPSGVTPLPASDTTPSVLTSSSNTIRKRFTTATADDQPHLAATNNDVALLELTDEWVGGIDD